MAGGPEFRTVQIGHSLSEVEITGIIVEKANPWALHVYTSLVATTVVANDLHASGGLLTNCNFPGGWK